MRFLRAEGSFYGIAWSWSVVFLRLWLSKRILNSGEVIYRTSHFPREAEAHC